jgi:hypothetical protein
LMLFLFIRARCIPYAAAGALACSELFRFKSEEISERDLSFEIAVGEHKPNTPQIRCFKEAQASRPQSIRRTAGVFVSP